MPPAASKRAASLTAVILLTHRAKTQSLASGKLSFGGIFSQRLHFQPTQQILSIFKYLQKNGGIKIIIHFMQALFKSVKKEFESYCFKSMLLQHCHHIKPHYQLAERGSGRRRRGSAN